MKLRELCDELGYEYDPNHSKRCLDKIKKDYLIEQNGNKKDYTIVRELTLKEKYSIKKLSNCKKVLRSVILSYISPNNIIRKDVKGFLELFNIVNNKYRYFSYEDMTKDKYDILKNYIEPENKGSELYWFVCDVHPMLKRLLMETLNQLVDEKIIYIKEYMMFGYYERFENDNGQIVETRHSVEADDKQIAEFLKYGREIMTEFGYKQWSDVPYHIKNKINNLTCRKMGISYVYNEYEIIANQDIKEIADKELQELKIDMNNSTIDKILRSTQGCLKDISFDDKKEDVELLIKKQP